MPRIGTYNEPFSGYGWHTDPFGFLVYTVPGHPLNQPPKVEGWEYFFIGCHGSYTNYSYKRATKPGPVEIRSYES